MKEGMIYQLFSKACRESNLPVKPSKDLDVIYKFAELLIKECGRVADCEEWISNTLALNQHFGIESKTKAGIEYTSNINAAPNIARGLASLIEKES